MEEIMQVFDYAYQNKIEGVRYLYNEPFLEDLERIISIYLRDGSITNIEDIPTVCGGLLSTHKKLIYKLQQNGDI